MPIHCCLDPQDPYAEREVRVAFAWTETGPRLITAHDAQGENILPNLIDAQCDDLLRELAEAARIPEEVRLHLIGSAPTRPSIP